MASAATNNSTMAWMIRTTSMDTSASCCMSGAPDSIDPQRSAAAMMATGLVRANRAMAMPSKPIKKNVPGWKNPLVPEISEAAARPANAPDAAIEATITRFTLIPA